jgi:zinc transport system ATP-binding protein
MSNETIVAFDGVSFVREGQVILDNVNLEVHRHDLTWIVGPNGGGKTTLIRLMLGLLRPTSGTVRVFDQRPERARRRIGYMAQQTSLDPRFPIDVQSVVLMGRLGPDSPLGPFRTRDKQLALQALDTVGLADFAGRPYSSLSGGQQRRLFIARALACEPDLLILDEPTAHLDPAVQARLYALLQDLQKQITIVMVSHDPTFVVDSVEQVVCVKQQVHVHPTSAFDSAMLGELYGDSDLRMVRHDKGHRHSPSEGEGA